VSAQTIHACRQHARNSKRRIYPCWLGVLCRVRKRVNDELDYASLPNTCFALAFYAQRIVLSRGYLHGSLENVADLC